MGLNAKALDGFYDRNKPVFRMGLIALIIAAAADLAAGMFLSSMEHYILMIPGMMVLVYSAIGMRGNIFGAMGSRLGTSMHMGTFRMSFGQGSVLRSNIESSIGLTFLISLAMGIIGYFFVMFFGYGDAGFSIWKFTFISMMGGLLAGLILLVFNIVIAKEGFKRDWDVDNITAPLIAAAGDIVTMPMLFVSAWLVVESPEELINVLTVVLVAVTVIVLAVIFARKLVRGRTDEAKRIISQSFPLLVACLILDIFAGLIIGTETEMLVMIPVLLILMPAFLNEGNALSGMLTARLSSKLHLGILKPDRIPGNSAKENFLITYVLAFATYAFIGIIAFIAAAFTGGAGIGFGRVMAIVLIAGMITATILNLLSYYVAVAAVKFDLDPDDHSIPITSSSMDLISAAVLMAVIVLFV